LAEDLANLLQLGVQIESITCDGHKALLKAIKHICPEVTVQRCLVHIQRMGRIWLSNKPKSDAGRDLKRIVSRLHLIDDTLQRDYWTVSLVKWHDIYKEYINQKSINPETGRYWYRHKMVRRTFMAIKKALPQPMGWSPFFGHLKGHINVHRGLSRLHRRQFIQWYLYLKNKK
jgi:hypothetical protein